MKTSLQSIAVLSMSFFIAACGGKTEGQSGGGGDDQSDSGTSDGGSGDGGTCAPMLGCNSTTSCPSPDGCNDCSCFDGNWACTEIACVDASTTCPASPPDIGTYCAEDGIECTFGTQCGPEFICRDNAWGMVIRTCPPPPPPACPPSPPSGSCIGQVGTSCSWGTGCNEESCQCVDAPGGPSWECEGTACVDAGHTGD